MSIKASKTLKIFYESLYNLQVTIVDTSVVGSEINTNILNFLGIYYHHSTREYLIVFEKNDAVNSYYSLSSLSFPISLKEHILTKSKVLTLEEYLYIRSILRFHSEG